MKCQNCGNENDSVALVCRVCGEKVFKTNTEQNPVANAEQNTNSDNVQNANAENGQNANAENGQNVNSDNGQNATPGTNVTPNAGQNVTPGGNPGAPVPNKQPTPVKKVKKKKKGGFLRGLLIVILVLFMMCLIPILGLRLLSEFKENRSLKAISGGFEIASAKDNKELWQNTMSDIEGLTVWEKYEMGLAVNDGSDTDGDGLTDKEEIEVYQCDPMKLSTAGDLYSDGYKVQNGMDVNLYYEYEGQKNYPYNACPEVKLEAQIPTDFNVVVTNHTGKGDLNGVEVYAQYEVYNYSGKVSIDLQSVLKQHEVSLEDIAVHVSDGKDIKKWTYKADGNVITLNKEMNAQADYEIYITEKNFLNNMAITFGASRNHKGNTQEVKGDGLVACSPLLTYIIGHPVRVYYQAFPNEKITESMREKVLNHTKDYLEEYNDFFYPEDNVLGVSAPEIKIRYEIIKNILPIFDVTYLRIEECSLYHALFMYYSYADKVAFEEQIEEQERLKSTSGFDIEMDTLPFGNFKTTIGKTGNCAGFSHLTAHVYNTGSFDKSGSYSNGKHYISWDLGNDSENGTLLDKGLSDYKTDAFVLEHSSDGEKLDHNLSSGEAEFVKMIEASYLQGNYYVNLQYQNAYGGENGKISFDYELIEEMKKRLESGQILDVYMRMVDKHGHAVNIYGYEEDQYDENTIWFNVYDSNFPMERVGDERISETGFKLKVTKKLKASGDGYRFEYSYFPLTNEDYGATSNIYVVDNPIFIVMDENWNDINPVAVYEGVEKDFAFRYPGVANAETIAKRVDGEKDHVAYCHYKDSYFENPSCGINPMDGYNPSLATASLCFAISAFGSNEGGTEDYSEKYRNVEAFLNEAGFEHFSYNDWFAMKPQSDSIGVASASKKLTVKEDDELVDYTLIAVAVRGGGYESEWAGNFTIGESGQHFGFAKAKEQVLEYLQEYIAEQNISGNIKLWLVGYSRAAATANLVAGAIDDGFSLGDNVVLERQNMYAYCFEPPKGALAKDLGPEYKYYNIFCIINKNDPVTKVAMAELGFTTYGVKYFLPDSTTDKDGYPDKEKAMLKFYENLDSYKDIKEKHEGADKAYTVDNFQMKKIVLENITKGTMGPSTIAIKYLLGRGKSPIEDDGDDYWTQSNFMDKMISAITREQIKTRKNYVDNYQNLIRTALTIMNETPFPNEPVERTEKFKEILIDKMGSDEFWMEYLGATLVDFGPGWGKSPGDVIDNVIAESMNEAGINYYSPNLIKDVGTALTDLLLPFVVSHPNYTVTAIYNIDILFGAHYPELCFAWLMSLDPEYTDAPSTYNGSGSYRIIKVNCPVKVKVYDENGDLVAQINEDKVKDIKKSSIVSLIDENLAKVVYLPANGAYEVEIIAVDEGEVNVSINEYSGDADSIVKVETYEDIAVTKGDILKLEVPAYAETDRFADSEVGSTVKYTVKDAGGTKLWADKVYTGSEIIDSAVMVQVVSEDQEKGAVLGSGMRYAGEFAVIDAYGNEGYHFVGWYEGDKLISEEREYRFKVTSDVTYTAKFEEGDEPLEFSDITDFIKMNWILFALAGVILATGATIIIVLVRRKKK